MRLEYVEVTLDAVMKYFNSGFEPKPHEEIYDSTWFIDEQKGIVIFKLYIDEKSVESV